VPLGLSSREPAGGRRIYIARGRAARQCGAFQPFLYTMSGRIQSFKKARRTPHAKRAGAKLNPHRQRALADRRRRVAARAFKLAEQARKAAIPAGA